jgi:HD-GYP domain-containing protein (c-di-GMP phosphodiesterase class II)
MLRLSLNQARPGMELALEVSHPHRPEITLLKTGAKLDQHSIPRLRELGVHEVWIKYPGLEDLVRFVNPVVLASCRELTSQVALALDSAMVQTTVKLQYADFKQAVVKVLEQFAGSPASQVFVNELVSGARPFVRHAGNVCVLSLLMGLKLEFYLVRERSRLAASAARDISGLGVGAMFHDIGMSRLDPAALERWNINHDENDPEWQTHAQIGFDLVKGDIDPSAAAVILHHHQKFDGSGFPERRDTRGKIVPLVGSDIHLFARIAGAADLYDRLRHPAHAPGADPSLTPSIPGVRALNMMRLKPYCAWMDPVVWRALIAVAPPYAPGSLVRLSDKRRAVVVDWTPENPCRPTVAILNESMETASSGRSSGPSERIDMQARPDLFIHEIDGFDVRHDHFEPIYEGEFELSRFARTLSDRAEDVNDQLIASQKRRNAPVRRSA